MNTDHVRFCERRGLTEAGKIIVQALVNDPDKPLPARKVLGEVELAVILPTALVPAGCVTGARYMSIAPGSDGVLNDGKVMKSV